jgi:hypothetical protein
VRALAHEVHGLAWDIGEFRRLHGRAERGLEELVDAMYHGVCFSRTEDTAWLALCRSALSIRRVVRDIEGQLRRWQRDLAELECRGVGV